MFAGYMFRNQRRDQFIDSEFVDHLNDTLLEADPLQKLDQLLVLLKQGLETPYQTVDPQQISPQAVSARNLEEISSLFDLGVEMDLLQDTNRGFSGSKLHFLITGEGWKHLRSITSGSSGSPTAFVAMDFRPELTSAFDRGIAPALRATGWDPIRADRVEHEGSIDDLVISQIRQSGLVVADFTFQNQGVYYEAGFAFGIGIQVIWTCR
ncbi:MAG: hypothetical protein IIC67_06645 [Thaumarchaeota archaeon]|nr:hypothetical protein [Nitrososphaerota archaeon]